MHSHAHFNASSRRYREEIVNQNTEQKEPFFFIENSFADLHPCLRIIRGSPVSHVFVVMTQSITTQLLICWRRDTKNFKVNVATKTFLTTGLKKTVYSFFPV